MPSEADILDFTNRWQASAAAETANSQPFTSERCELLGVERPRPQVHAEQDYVFERRVHNAQSGTTNFIDLYRRGCFAWKDKQDSGDASAKTSLSGERVKLKRSIARCGTPGWKSRHDRRVRACVSARRGRRSARRHRPICGSDNRPYPPGEALGRELGPRAPGTQQEKAYLGEVWIRSSTWRAIVHLLRLVKAGGMLACPWFGACGGRDKRCMSSEVVSPSRQIRYVYLLRSGMAARRSGDGAYRVVEGVGGGTSEGTEGPSRKAGYVPVGVHSD